MKACVCRCALALCLGLLLGGCAGLLHSDARPEETYYLRARAASVSDAAQSVAVSLRVGHPTAARVWTARTSCWCRPITA